MDNKRSTNYQLLTTNWRQGRSGFTLLEFLIAFSIIGLVSILVAAVYFAHSRLFSNQNTQVGVASQNRLALDEMVNQIRESQAVVSTCALCTPDSTSNTVLIVQLWPIDSSGEPVAPPGSDYDYILYKRNSTDNKKLIKKIIPGSGSFRQSSERIIATDISDLQFTYNNTDYAQVSEVTINLTTSANTGVKIITSTQTAKAVLRNK